MDTMFEVPGSTVSSVHINKEAVEGTTCPFYQHRKEEGGVTSRDYPEERRINS